MTGPIDYPTYYSTPSSSFLITELMLRSLRQTRPWVRFLSILGFMSVGLMILIGGLNVVGFSHIGAGEAFLPFYLIGTINILMGILYFFPAFFSLKMPLPSVVCSMGEVPLKWRKSCPVRNLSGNLSE
jgi:hypothetical protein